MNEVFILKDNTYKLRNFYMLKNENQGSNKYGLAWRIERKGDPTLFFH